MLVKANELTFTQHKKHISGVTVAKKPFFGEEVRYH
jgi:hypothetical protein